MRDDFSLGFGIKCTDGFPVGAQQVGGMVFRDEAHLAGGGPRAIDNKVRLDIGLRTKRRRQRPPRIVLAHDADIDAARTEARDVARHVAGAANLRFFPPHRQHRRRRFRGDAGHVAIDELVEHKVADAKHGLRADPGQYLLVMLHLWRH